MFSALEALKIVVSGDGKKAGRRKRERGTGQSASTEQIEAGIEISWLTEEPNGTRSKVSFRTIVELTYREALSHLRLKPGEPRNRVTLVKMFSDSIAARFRKTIEQQGYSKVVRVHGKVDGASFDEVMGALERRGSVIQAEPPKYVKQRSKYWQLSPAGAKRLETE
jgi:hypothetical protein